MNPLLPTLLGFLSGYFTAVFAEPLRRLLWAPKLELSFGSSTDFLTKTPEIGPAGQYEALYVRFKVVNTRWALAKSCRAYLVKVERRASSGLFELTEYAESLQLSWASLADQSYSAIDLPKGVPHFVDVISTRPMPPSPKLEIKVTPFRYVNLLGSFGTYRFTVIVSGDGAAPQAKAITLSWGGAWDQVFAVEP